MQIEKEQSGYSRIWTGNLAAGSSEFIRIDEGEYSVGMLLPAPVLKDVLLNGLHKQEQDITFIKELILETVFM